MEPTFTKQMIVEAWKVQSIKVPSKTGIWYWLFEKINFNNGIVKIGGKKED